MPSENREQEIKLEAQRILDKFARALEKVETRESYVERDECERKEGEGKHPDSEFREIMFENAPKTKNGCIEAERGGWK